MERCLVFPGQGTQRAGMFREIQNYYADIKNVFELASDISGKDVRELCLSASEEILKQTENTQICVTAMNLAYYSLLKKEGVEPTITLGHSLGQFSALVAAGVISMEDTFRLVNQRARLMKNVSREGMLCTILGLDFDVVDEIVKNIDATKQKISIALYNTKQQIVVGGEPDEISRAEIMAKERGALKTVRVKVSCAFHTPLMQEMEGQFSDCVDKVQIHAPNCALLLNCKGDFENNPEKIREDIKLQSYHTVLWYDCLKKLLNCEELIVAEVGLGKTMAGMVRNTNSSIKVFMVSNPKQYINFISLAT